MYQSLTSGNCHVDGIDSRGQEGKNKMVASTH